MKAHDLGPRLISAAALFLVWGCCSACGGGIIPSSADPAFITDQDRRCEVSDRCLIVASSCCPCSATGELTAINAAVADAVADAVSARPEICLDQGCASAISDDETCCATRAECVNGRCELIGLRGESLVDDCGTRPTEA